MTARVAAAGLAWGFIAANIFAGSTVSADDVKRSCAKHRRASRIRRGCVSVSTVIAFARRQLRLQGAHHAALVSARGRAVVSD